MNRIRQTATRKILYTGLFLFAIAWIGVGIQHFMYLKFVATLVPAYMPMRELWAALTGSAMILAGISFLLRLKVPLAALLLSVMMMVFMLMIHAPKLITTPRDIIAWTRALQDCAILGAAMMLTAKVSFIKTGRYLYATPMLLLGAGHFMHLQFNTAKVPDYFPSAPVFDIVIGIVMILLALCILMDIYTSKTALVLGVLLLLFALLSSAPVLVKNINAAVEWTAFLLALAIAAGAFIAAAKHK